jgi:hypothetical protein
MHTHTRVMSGVGTKNSSRVIPAEPRASITTSRASGTVILTHNRANLLDRAPKRGRVPTAGVWGYRVLPVTAHPVDEPIIG